LHYEGLSINLLAGEFLGHKAPTLIYSPLVGLHLQALDNAKPNLPLHSTFEYGILPLTGSITVEGEVIDPDTLLYLGRGRKCISLHIPRGEQALIIGGEPFSEEILMWWNFVARTKQEIVEAVHGWNSRTRFGAVKDYPGDRLIAPEMV
jgi:hypothetical protein